MDVDMFRNERTQENISALQEVGCFIIEPDAGELASGLSGPGRLPEVDKLVAYIDDLLSNSHQDLKGRRVLVTAGPTHEPIDPVRYIGNHSSGKMGFAVARAAALRGAEVTLISGPVQLRTPRNVRRINVTTACEMMEVTEKEFTMADLVVMASAVADYAPVDPANRKIKREEQPSDSLTITLRKNPDILKTLGGLKSLQVLVGFALETHDGMEHARKKLAAKNLDMIVLNNAGEEGAGFMTDTNIVTILTADGKLEALPKLTKFDVANVILHRAVPLLK
jgi:phosphopantothenoylcysteine decarboxylase/phosphopantothenate--cysteine ligase